MLQTNKSYIIMVALYNSSSRHRLRLRTVHMTNDVHIFGQIQTVGAQLGLYNKQTYIHSNCHLFIDV